ncbi:unnamed protein product [Gongylonema pulchrum]|uniref:Uncharacterized protein n=1 Tax=Gongylonema pulchrum TaxID=637853 RepID=A0A3P6PMC9_9BILA|nr:unnamed protein product [Gongylonema pulchrum]
MYLWAGEEPSESCACSPATTDGESSDGESVDSAPSVLVSDDENRPALLDIKIEPDAAASLLSHLDIDTNTSTLTKKDDDESTLKGTAERSALGPRDFSQFR